MRTEKNHFPLFSRSLLFNFFLLLFIEHGISAQSRENKEKPNVLLIMVDDMNDWVGCLEGHPNALTPNIDRLAAQGMLFTHAYTAAPISNPSRVALLSGLGPYTTGVYHNRDPWGMSGVLDDIIHLPLHFMNNGYYTMTVGKIFHTRPDDWEDAFYESGGRFGGQNFNLFSREYTYPFSGLEGIHNWAVHWGPLDEPEASRLSDPKIAGWAVERLSRDYDKPFFLSVGFHRPHTPLTSPREFHERFETEEVYLPLVNEDDLSDIPPMGRQVAIGGYQEMQDGTYRQVKSREVHREIVKSYLAACTFVDAQVGKVLEALEESPYKDNTIVILASDHGWSLGEQTHFKKWALWETTTHVPFIVHVPGAGLEGKRCDAGVTLLDIYPTLVDLCGLPSTGHRLDGRSLRPLLEDTGNSEWQRPGMTTFGRNNHGLRNERWRYIRYADGMEELYDHDRDPGEWTNLANLPEYEQVKEFFAGWLPSVNVPAVNTDHELPVRLTPDSPSRSFIMITPKFTGKPVSIRAEIGPETGDGVIVCQGSQFTGYALYIQDGFLCFAVMDVPVPLRWDRMFPSRTVVKSLQPLASGKQEVRAVLARDGKVTLYANGKEIGSGKAKTLSTHPAGNMIMGRAPERYVPVGNYSPPFEFGGEIKEVVVDVQ